MNNFEFNAKADEWLDVTSCEEILRNELNQTKNVLETKQMELLELNVTIDFLKGDKTLLEHERESLRAEIAEANETVAANFKNLERMTADKKGVEKELSEARSSSKSKIQTIEELLVASEKNLKTCNVKILALEQDIITLKEQQKREKTGATTMISKLNAQNEKMKKEALDATAICTKQMEQIAQLQRAVGESRARENGLRQDIHRQSRIIEQRNAEVKETNDRIGMVSVLAQTLKEKNFTLIRSTASVQQRLNESIEKHNASVQREGDLKQQVAHLNSLAMEKSKKQEQMVLETLTKLEQAEDRMASLESYAYDVKEQFVVVSEERDCFANRLAEKEYENKSLLEEKAGLEQKLEETTRAFAGDLELLKSFSDREESLKAELENQKTVFDARLKEIRTILGVSAIAEIKREISTVGKLYAEHHQRIRSCPSVKSPTLRVPLMLGMQHQKAN